MKPKDSVSVALVVFCVVSVVWRPLYGDGQGGAPTPLELLEVGPGDLGDADPPGPAFDVPTLAMGNVARQGDAVAFGSRSSFGALHDTVIDGLYGGNWRGNGGTDSTAPGGVLESCGSVHCVHPDVVTGGLQCSYVGIYWANGPVTLAEIALGSNNTNRGAITQRNYILQYTRDTFTPKACLSSDNPCDDSANLTGVTWTTFGVANAHLLGDSGAKTLRHRYRVSPPIEGVRALRVIKVENDDLDEIEVGNAPNTLGEPPPAELTLKETGGPYTTPAEMNDVPTAGESNVARGGDAVAFASSTAGVGNLTNGLYGAAWVGANGPTSGMTYAGVYFRNGEKTIQEIAISRDNTGTLNNLTTGSHAIEFTTDTFDRTSDASVDGANWIRPTRHLASGHVNAASSCKGLRHRYVLNGPVEVRAIRVVTAEGNAFDEIEVGLIIAADLDSALTPLAGFTFLGAGPKTPPFQVPTFEDGNIARAADARPFASLTRAAHGVRKLNDGLYLDTNGWNAANRTVTRPRSYAAYAGVYWAGGLQTVQEIAVGRDNGGGHSDRHDGAFAVHYTTDFLDFVNGGENEPAVGEAKWIAVGTLRSHPLGTVTGTGDQFEDILRHSYELLTPIQARAIRVSARPAGLATHFDELEVFGNAIVNGNEQLAGDCNQDGTRNLSDVICLLGFLFQNDPLTLPCSNATANLALMDCNNDGAIDISDAIHKIAFLFQGGPAPVQGVNCFGLPGCPQNRGCP